MSILSDFPGFSESQKNRHFLPYFSKNCRKKPVIDRRFVQFLAPIKNGPKRGQKWPFLGYLKKGNPPGLCRGSRKNRNFDFLGIT